MRNIGPRFEVTITRVQEGMRDAPVVTLTARSVSVDPKGLLEVKGEGWSRSYSSWDHFEVRRVTPPTNVDASDANQT